MKDFTNADRAKRAEAALKSYNGDNDAAVNALDFLVDLQHCARVSGVSFPETSTQQPRAFKRAP